MEEGFVAVCQARELDDGDLHPFAVPEDADKRRLLVKAGGEIFALSATCPHLGADLGEGVLQGGVLVCPHHGSGFDCRTGESLHPPAKRPLVTYRVRLEGETVLVAVEADSSCVAS